MDPEQTSLPLWAAGLSTLAAILLFFQTTAPALRERAFLERTEQRVRSAQTQLLQDLNQETRQRVAMEIDPAAVLRELVKRGYDPAELLAEDGAAAQPRRGTGPGPR